MEWHSKAMRVKLKLNILHSIILYLACKDNSFKWKWKQYLVIITSNLIGSSRHIFGGFCFQIVKFESVESTCNKFFLQLTWRFRPGI